MSAMPSGSMGAGGGGSAAVTDQKTFGQVCSMSVMQLLITCIIISGVGLTRQTRTV